MPRCRAKRLVFAAFAGLFAFLPAPLLAQDAQPAPRVTGQAEAQGAEVVVNQVDAAGFPRVRVFATVLRDGRPVRDLGAQDFRVREDEVDQGPLTVEPRLIPLHAVVVLDTSGSMRPRLAEAKAAAAAFIDGLGPQDRVRALSFAREVRVLNGPGAERGAAKAGLAGTTARGDTALYDAIHAAVELSREQPGRKAVVLLSDGADDDGTGKQLSKRSLTEAIELAKAVSVPVYAIGLGTEIDDGILRRVAEETGGQYYRTPEAGQLRGLYARIGEQLSGQYSISYESNLPADGTDHRLGLTAAGVTGTKLFRPPQGQTQAVAPAAQTAAPVAAATEGHVAGGGSFDTAVPIEPGRTYRLKDHLPKGEFAYFSFEAKGGQTVSASVHTGTKGVRLDDGVERETAQPYAGLIVANGAQEMMGKRVDIVGDPLKREGVTFKVPPGRGGPFYLLVGSIYAAQHWDADFTVQVTGEGEAAGTRDAPTPRRAADAMERVTGGDSFEAAVPLELGRTYRLGEHLQKGEVAYFYVEAPAGKTLQANVHTGTKGVRIDEDGTVQETDQPYAALALAGADRRMLGQRQDIVGDALARKGAKVRPTGNKGGRVYVLVGSTYAAQHRDADFAVGVAEDR